MRLEVTEILQNGTTWACPHVGRFSGGAGLGGDGMSVCEACLRVATEPAKCDF